MRKALTQISTIKSYFSRRTALKKKGKITTDTDIIEADDEADDDDEAEIMNSDTEDEDSNEHEQIERAKVTASISMVLSGVDIKKDEWIAVGYPRGWYPSQFMQFDPEEGEIQVDFLQRSASNPKWFVWPELTGCSADIS